MSVDDLAEVRRRISAAVEDSLAAREVDLITRAAKAVGIRKARTDVLACPDRIAEVQHQLRATQEAERAAKERHASEVVAAEWELDGRFGTQSNKTWLLEGCANPGAHFADTDHLGGCAAMARQMTAEQRERWKAAEAARQPAVAKAADELRRAEHAVAAARDALATEERRFSAAKADLQGAIAEMAALGNSITTNDDRGGNR